MLFASETGWRVTLSGQKLPVLMAIKGTNVTMRCVAAESDALLKVPVTELDAFSIQPKGGLDTLQHWKIFLEVAPSVAKLALLDAQGHVVKIWPFNCRSALKKPTSTSYDFFEGAAGNGLRAEPFYNGSLGRLFTK